MARRKRQLSLDKIFTVYNRKYFGGKIKLSSLSLVRMSHLTAGETTFCDDNTAPFIKINKALANWGRCVRIVLLHEMAHASLPWYVEHGPKFRKRIRRLVKQGAYDDLL